MMGQSYIEEDKLGKAYDSKLMRRLLLYLKPYKYFIVASLFLLLFTTIFDVSLPYITKTAIDRYIVPQKAKLVIGDEEIEKTLLKKYGDALIPIDDGIYIVELSKLPRGEKIALEKKGILRKERYWFIEEGEVKKNSSVEEIIHKNPSIFQRVERGYIASVEELRKLKKDELRILRRRDIRGIVRMGLLFFSILLFNFIFSFGHTYILQYTGQRVMYDMRIQIFSHLLKLPLRFFDKNPVGRLVTRATNDVSAINEMYTSVLIYLVKDLLLIIGIMLVMFRMNTGLTLLILLLAPLVFYIAFIFRKKARDAYREVRRKLASLNAFLQESISGIRIIHLFASEKTMDRKFKGINHEYYNANMKQLYVFAVFRPLIEVVSAVAIAMIIWYGGGEVIKKSLSFGALVAFLSYVEMLFQPIRDLSDKYNILQGAMAAAERIFKLLEEEEEDKEKGGRILSRIKGEIEFKNVWFAYEDEEWVLKDVSFRINPGETVALVGPTGAGKTSIINLLFRFYDVNRGQILLDGHDLRDIDLNFLRSQMAIVLQDVFLFSGDILSNIGLRNHIEEEKIKEAASYVYASTFIEKLPNGYRTVLGERGTTLSVGQRQLLAFARAIAFDPKILVLDEATSNIDTQTEVLIQKALKRLLAGRTSIVIAHRLSTVKDADRIIVIYKGKVVEEGTHQELLKKKGLYYQLYMIQFKGEEKFQSN
jgi:ATP-binding cassette subfamily B protein/subfamily B ATP-binding cassette protein MsbA